MEKIKKLLLFYLALNISFFAVLFALSLKVDELNIETFFPLLLPWFVYSISFFILAADYEPAYTPAKKINYISAGIRGISIIIAYICIGSGDNKTAFIILISVLSALFLANLILDLLSRKSILNNFSVTEKVFLEKVNAVTDEDIKRIEIYRKAILKSTGAVFCFIISLGILISFGISLNLFYEDKEVGLIIFWIFKALLLFFCTFKSYKSLIIRTKLYFLDKKELIRRLKIEIIFLSLAYLTGVGMAVIGFLDASIQFLPMLISVLLLVPIFKTNRIIAIKLKLTEEKKKTDILGSLNNDNTDFVFNDKEIFKDFNSDIDSDNNSN